MHMFEQNRILYESFIGSHLFELNKILNKFILILLVQESHIQSIQYIYIYFFFINTH